MCFEEIIKRISPKLKGIVYRLKSYFPFFSMDDLYQEAMSHLWVDYKEGKLSDKTDSYILQGCYFYLKNYIRKNKSRVLLISLDGIIYDEKGEEHAMNNILSLEDPHSALDDIHANFLLEQINNNGLTKREKEVFHLVLEGLTTREIGRRLGVSHVRIVKLQKRIREKCREHLDMC
ncbi:MAG: sigma-70 family RNA polymerase sigma factor [Candidatus Omnitrophica bacterium]|nr:sigma-70 family RNA polymerase sigma factor [Candidatus Omnitrophota bacterium]